MTVISVFMNTEKNLPFNVQTCGFYQGIIHDFYGRAFELQIGILRIAK